MFDKELAKDSLIYVRASIAGSLCFLIQFMSSHKYLFFDVISWIFSLKNDFLVLLTILLNFFQSEIDLNI